MYHFGIRGQKWGLRRYQNPDGTLTEAGRKRYGINSEGKFTSQKGATKWYRESEKANKIMNRSGDLSTDFDRTKDGKLLKKEFNKVAKRYFNQIDDDPKLEAEFVNKEEKYLRASQEYVIKNLLKEYGMQEVSIYAHSGGLVEDGKETTKDLIKYYSDEWYIHAE